MLKVLVYGGTGTQARPTVERLLEQGHQPVVISRNSDSAVPDGAMVVKGNLADAKALLSLNKDMDAVAFLVPAFLGEGDDAASFGRNAIDAAVKCGVKKFVWNASGPIPDDDESDSKTQIFKYLQATDLNWTVFEPTTYMENWLGPWTAPFVKRDNEVTYPVLDHVRIGWLASDDVGSLVVAALTSDDVSLKRFEISGIESPTGPELARIYGAALGRDIAYRAMTPEEMGAVIDQAFGAGSGGRIAALYRAEQQDPNPEPKFHDMSGVLELLPVKMTTIECWVKKHSDAF